MKEELPSRQNGEEIRELVNQFLDLRDGKSNSFLDEDAFEKVIDHFDDVEDVQKALEAAQMGAEQFPYSSSLQIKKADLLIATRQYHKALQILDRVELLDKNDIDLYILRTDAYLALDMQEKAASMLEYALQLFEGEERIELLFELADVYDDYEEFDKLFDCLKLILEQEPVNEEALYKICFWTDFTGRNEESIRLHQKIIDEFPYCELAWFNLAAAYQGLKLYEKAVDAYKYAIVIDEKFDYAYRNMGDAYIRMKRYRDAIDSLEKVLELSRPEDVIYEALGHCHDRLKHFAQARFYYRKASHLNHDDSKLYYKIACTYLNEGQWTAAVRQLDTALGMFRSQPEYNLAMGECKMQLGQFKDAIHHYNMVIRHKPKMIAGWEALIRCLFFAEHYTEATVQVQQALRLTDYKPVFLFYAALVHLASGKSKEGLIFLESGMKKSPRMLRKIIQLDPSLLQNNQVLDIVARYKKKNAL